MHQELEIAEKFQGMLDELNTVTVHPNFSKMLVSEQRYINYRKQEIQNYLDDWTRSGTKDFSKQQYNTALYNFYHSL